MAEKKIKVIGVGFQKTGTTSLFEALTILGYQVGDNNYKLLPAILKKNWSKVFKTLNRYDAVEDNPWPLIYKEIDKAIPDCKFILTVREKESWYKSVSYHIDDLKNPMHEWIYGRNKSLPKNHKENTIDVYDSHNEEVLKYFKDRPTDLLVIDLVREAGWEKLCAFLEEPIPLVEFPHRNKSEYKQDPQRTFWNKMNLKKKAVKYFFQIQLYRWMGLLK